jgi:uncharacterized RDD family membrane protein YckC
MGELTNPYAAPQADDHAPLDHTDGYALPDAPKGTRFANLFIDYILNVILIAVLTMMVPSEAWSGLLGYPVMIGYYLFFEGMFGATPGKMITKTRVVRTDGGKPSFGQIFGRTLARYVPFEPFSFFGGTPTGWHDRWSGTRVVRSAG